jgi:CRP-like cAMP-binding protein
MEEKTHDLVEFVKQSELFHGLSHEEIGLLLPLIRCATYAPRSFIVREDEKGDELFLIQSGSVEILKKDNEHDTPFRLNELQAGEWFGEMAVLGMKTRMTSARTLEETEVVIVHLRDLDRLVEKSPAFSKILKNIATKAAKRLEGANETIVKSMKQDLKVSKTHDHMGRFIVHLFILLTLFVYTLKFFELYGSHSKISQLAASAFIIIFALTCVLFVKFSRYPLEFYGLSMKNWQKNSIEAVVFTLPLLLAILAFKWILIQTVPEFEDLSLFQFGTKEKQPSFFQRTFNHFFAQPPPHDEAVNFHVILTFYIVLVPVQEFIARGCLQGSLRLFFTTSNRAFLAILTSNLLFGLFHTLKTFTFALAAFVFGIFWGWLYERQKTIVGPCISHALIGIWAFAVLNFQAILIY